MSTPRGQFSTFDKIWFSSLVFFGTLVLLMGVFGSLLQSLLDGVREGLK